MSSDFQVALECGGTAEMARAFFDTSSFAVNGDGGKDRYAVAQLNLDGVERQPPWSKLTG